DTGTCSLDLNAPRIGSEPVGDGAGGVGEALGGALRVEVVVADLGGRHVLHGHQVRPPEVSAQRGHGCVTLFVASSAHDVADPGLAFASQRARPPWRLLAAASAAERPHWSSSFASAPCRTSDRLASSRPARAA